jgi:putative copper export protein
MFALRFAGSMAAAVWVGGLLTLGTIVAPVLFPEILSNAIADRRAVAAALFGELLRRFHLVPYGCAGVILGSLVVRAILGPRPRRFGLRVGLTLLMLAVSVYSGFALTGRFERLREDIGASPANARGDNPHRLTFARLQRESTALMLVPLTGTIILLISELKD